MRACHYQTTWGAQSRFTCGRIVSGVRAGTFSYEPSRRVAATVGVRQIIRAMILSEAMAVACLRRERTAIPRPNLADARLLWTLRETTRLMNMELVDYFVAQLATADYHSWREHERPAA